MTNTQKVKALTAAVDGLVSIIVAIIALTISNEHTATVLLALVAALQPVAAILIVALTSTENTTIKAASVATIATIAASTACVKK